ncbi:MAG: hypothetical protein ACTHK2_13595 [Dokdonella sp.]|uniref:hypothetical protein n=1 Tax=Dokdonella sp. TaxID=2291710 RepID=UPI003F7F4F73
MDDGAVPTPLSPLRRAANVGGTLLCIVAIAFLARRGYTLGVSIGDGFARIGAGAFAVAIACYAAAAAMLGVAWVALVRIAAGHRVAAAPLYTSHLRAQLAKYLPGNVFHVAYRHVAARRAGVGHAPLALALGMETLLIVASAGTLSVGVSSDARIVTIAPWAHGLAWAAWSLPVVGAFAVSVYARRAGRRIALPNLLRGIAGVLAIHLAFVALSALALRSLAPGGGGLSIGSWCGWFALAWVLGYVTPGAPAGLGVRETVLVLGLGPALGDAQALVVALAYRLVTVVVDAALAGIGFVLRGRP